MRKTHKVYQNFFILIEEYSNFDTLSVGNEKLSTDIPQATKRIFPLVRIMFKLRYAGYKQGTKQGCAVSRYSLGTLGEHWIEAIFCLDISVKRDIFVLIFGSKLPTHFHIKMIPILLRFRRWIEFAISLNYCTAVNYCLLTLFYQ